MGNGDLPPQRPDQSYNPPPGGQAVAGQRTNIRAKQVIIIGGNPPSAGLYVYNPALAFDDLIASIAANSGTDLVGNAVIQGIANYFNNGVTYQAIVMQNGQLVFYSANNETGPWTTEAIISCGGFGNPLNIQAAGTHANQSVALAANPSGQVVFQSPFAGTKTGNNVQAVGTSTSPLLLLDNTGSNLGSSESLAFIAANVGDKVEGIQVSGDTFDRFNIAADGTMTWGPGNAAPITSLTPVSATAGLTLLINRNNTNALTIQNIGTNGGQPLVQLTTSVAADRALGIQAAGDTSERVRIDSVPQLLFGSGSAAGDCTFARAGPQEFFSDGIAAKISGAAEVWNAATFANGWANAATPPNLQYRLVAAPYNCIQWVGRITAPAGVVAGQAITAAPAAAYHPTHLGDIIAWDATANTPQLFRVGTGGALFYQAGTIVAGDIITLPVSLVSLDA